MPGSRGCVGWEEGRVQSGSAERFGWHEPTDPTSLHICRPPVKWDCSTTAGDCLAGSLRHITLTLCCKSRGRQWAEPVQGPLGSGSPEASCKERFEYTMSVANEPNVWSPEAPCKWRPTLLQPTVPSSRHPIMCMPRCVLSASVWCRAMAGKRGPSPGSSRHSRH